METTTTAKDSTRLATPAEFARILADAKRIPPQFSVESLEWMIPLARQIFGKNGRKR